MRDQGSLARSDFLLSAFVFRLAGRFRFPITALDLPLLAAFFLAGFLVPAVLGLGLLALLGRVQALLPRSRAWTAWTARLSVALIGESSRTCVRAHQATA
ncbi:MAG: hypothetical protein H6973_18710 [Gammaproteobacteria bacterium]|nr:hypothetical protein [Gammaproteobacteria bacterium]